MNDTYVHSYLPLFSYCSRNNSPSIIWSTEYYGQKPVYIQYVCFLEARHRCYWQSTSSKINFQTLMVRCFKSVEPHTITQHITSFTVFRERNRFAYLWGRWLVIIPSRNGDCIPILFVCIRLSFTLEFFTNNCIPNTYMGSHTYNCFFQKLPYSLLK